MDQLEIMKSLDGNVSRKSALDVLMQVDEYLESLNIYAYPNWFSGEIVDGPRIEKYWVTVTLMYPRKMMPDPAGAERIIASGGKVYYAEDSLISAAKLVDPTDRAEVADPRRPGQNTAKKVKRPIWLVTLEIPKQYMDTVTADRLSVDDNQIDLDKTEKAQTTEIEGGDEFE